MKRWLVFLLGGLETLVVLAVVYFEPTFCVRGQLWGEAFFEGRPTSYWNQELEHWEVRYTELSLLMVPPIHGTFRSFERRQSAFERWRVRWLPSAENAPPANGPSVLRGGDEAKPVLDELLRIASPKVCRFAYIGLGKDPEMPQEDINTWPFPIQP